MASTYGTAMSRNANTLHRPMLTADLCPHCGQPMPLEGLPEGAKLSPLQLRMFGFLRLAGKLGLTVAQLQEKLYSDKGTPPSSKTIHVHVHLMRKELNKFGWTIESTRGPCACYTLIRMPTVN